MGTEHDRDEMNTAARPSIAARFCSAARHLPPRPRCATGAAQAQTPPAQKPNILFMLVDNLGYGELGVYGGGATRGAPTPRIDRLASEGLRLTNMNMEAQCTPSRSAILTGRYAIRSGTHSVPFGGVADGLTQWEVTMAESLSSVGYATALNGKWHLGSNNGRLPNDQGFDEWYGIPRTTDEAMWPGSPGYSPAIMPPEQIMEGRKGEKSRDVKVYDLEQRRLIDAEITRRSIAFMEREVQAEKALLRLRDADAAASADAAQSGIRRQDRQWRLGRHAGRDGS